MPATSFPGLEFENELATRLRKAKIPYSRNPGIAGASPDFVINTSDGRRLVLEAKTWSRSDATLDRAAAQAKFYKEITNADAAAIVVPWARGTNPGKGVVSADQVVDFVASSLGNELHLVRPTEKIHYRSVFCAMPFAAEYDDTYRAMAKSAKSARAIAKRVDFEDFHGDVVNEIETLIKQSNAVIADLSESKGNVLYETGFAHALGLPTIHICSTPLSKLPFDVRNWKTIQYAKGQTYKLIEVLKSNLRLVLGR